MVGLARHPSRMKARITTASAECAAAIIRYKRVGAHARGSLIIPNSPSSVPSPLCISPLEFPRDLMQL